MPHRVQGGSLEQHGRDGATDSESHELEPARRRRRGAGWTRRNAGRTDKSHGQHLHKFQRGISEDWPFRSFKRTP